MAINKDKIAAAAQKQFKKGNFRKAIQEYQKIVTADPSETRYWKRIGDLQVRAGDKAGAVETYLRISDDFLSKGFHKKALAILRQIQALDSSIEEVYHKLAKIYIATDFVGDALHALEQLVQLLDRNNKTDEMLAVLEEMAQVDPSKVIHRIHYAETLSRLNKTREAAREFKRVATHLKSEQNDDDYVKVAERLLFHDPNDMEVLRDLAEAYIRQRNPQRILKRLLEVYQSYPGDLENLHVLARVFLSLDRKERAIQVYKEMARLHVEAGQREQSRTVFERILEIDPRDRDALKGLGRHKERRPIPKTPLAKEVSAVELDATDLIEEEEIEELEIEELIEVAEDDKDLKLIEESEAFFRYGLIEKADTNLENVQHQDHPRFLLLKKEIYIKQAKKADALKVLHQLADYFTDHEPERAVDMAQEALQLQSGVGWAEKLLSEMGSSMPNLKPLSTEEIAAVLDLDDALNILDELDDANAVLDVSSLNATGEMETINPQTHSNEEIDAALTEQEKLKEDREALVAIETDLQEMLASLQGLTDTPSSSGSQTSDLILDTSGLRDDPNSAYSVGSTLGHDELEELKEASQSLIRITELSKEELDIDDLADQDEKAQGLPDADEFIAFNLADLDETPGENGAPEEEATRKPDRELDDFLLNLDDALEGIPDADVGGAKTASPTGESALEATMDNYQQLMSLDDKLQNELHSLSEGFDTPIPESEEVDSPEEEPLPDEVTDTLEEVEFFLEMDLFQEALDALVELRSRFPLPAVERAIERVAKEGGLQTPPALPSTGASSPQDEASPMEQPTTSELDEPTPVISPEASSGSPSTPRISDAHLDEPTPISTPMGYPGSSLEIVFEDDELDDPTPVSIPEVRFGAPKAITFDEELDEPTPVSSPEHPAEVSSTAPGSEAEASSQPLDTEITAVTTHEALLKQQNEQAADEPKEEQELFEDLTLDGLEENLDLNFDGEESAGFEELRFLKEEQHRDSPGVDRAVRIETEQPIGDAGTHLDLGIAYKEMGLYSQALEEMKKALDDSATEIQARLLMGKCYLELGQGMNAANEMKRALHGHDLKESEELDLYFELGRVYESLQDHAEALYYFKKVFRRDSHYRGVAEIISRLKC